MRDPVRQRAATALAEPAARARELARRLGLDPRPVTYWLVDHEEMNELVAYDGFQRRYPHWRWGMAYERNRLQRRHLGGKAFELVVNDDPAHAVLQESNTRADQKAVITHVEAHADFFEHNRWFPADPDAAAMLGRHADAIEAAMADPDVDREAVERFIDHASTIADHVDLHDATGRTEGRTDTGTATDAAGEEPVPGLDVSEDVREAVFGDYEPDEEAETGFPPEPVPDLLGFLGAHGRAYDEAEDRAVELTDWQRTVIEVVRREARYFAPQRLTKVQNEGWAAYWESMMMGECGFADADELLDYADHQSRVLGSPGFNPYKIGKELWEHVEVTAARRAVVERLLRVEGITPETFHDRVDHEAVLETLAPPEALAGPSMDRLEELAGLPDRYVDQAALDRARAGELDLDAEPWAVLTRAGLARRHFALVKPQHRGALARTDRATLEETYRYLVERDRYGTVGAALADVDHAAGWDRMLEVRESHNDVTFLDEFLTQEFVDERGYFAFERSAATGADHATSTDADAVRRKLLLRVANLGKPTVVVADANHRNRGELRLVHEFNGVALDLEDAAATLEHVFELWGRPVELLTVDVRIPDEERTRAEREDREPGRERVGLRLRYDGTDHERERVDPETVPGLTASELDYDTRPDDWLA